MNFIILSSYYQNRHASANGICAKALVEELRKKGHHVNVVCYGDALKEHSEQNLYEISPKADYSQYSNIWKRRIVAYLDTIKSLVRPSFDVRLVEAYVSTMDAIAKEEKIDIIIAMFFPYETAIAASIFKKKHSDIYSVIYELDSIGDGITSSSSIDKRKNFVAERSLNNIYKNIDKIMVMSSHLEFWRKTHSNFANKLLEADIPMIIEPATTPSIKGLYGTEINGIYSGLLNSKYRSPEYLLRVLELINRDNTVFKVDFYSKGDCENIIREFQRSYRTVRACGYVSRDELETANMRADVFISIGNSLSNSVPSKLFSYLSTGKPIIHLASQRNDVCIKYLSRYKQSLVIFTEDPLNDNAELLIEFLSKCNKELTEFVEVKKLFLHNTPEYNMECLLKEYALDNVFSLEELNVK